ncbi:MAG TPA: ABC transporter ATP-binding protein [Candidatus Saccharimonadales bacterium]|nr:ABC transporter ATP-binding protein [Candidatus Saccharimonadales bacterium]
MSTAPANTITPAIQLTRLTKQYAGTKKPALRNVSLTVQRGEVYGFLGPNGAGKSTTIRCLLNFILPTSGGASILGKDSVDDSVAIRRNLGYLSGDVALYKRMTGQQFLSFMATLQPLKHPGHIRELTRDFRAELSKPIDTLSKGNRQKIGLIQAFMHEPDILILDEPTSGLDPLMQEVFFAQISAARARGATVFVSSHYLPEVRRICDRIGFIRDGRLVAEQSIAELAASAAHTFDITFSEAIPLTDFTRFKNLHVTPSHDPRHITVEVHGDLMPFLRALARHRVIQFDQRAVNLEEEFMRLYGKDDE